MGMPRDKSENHNRIMAAAREEFMTCGFEKASMRVIANRCGLTAAGLYRHCKDKEDLFYQLVRPAVEKLDEWILGHVDRYEQCARQEGKIVWQDTYIDMMREVVYPNKEDYHLLVAKSKGSKYENFLHDMSERAQDGFLAFLEELKESGKTSLDIKPQQLHLLLSAYITALFEPIVHNYSYEDALASLDAIEMFFLPGWKHLMTGSEY